MSKSFYVFLYISSTNWQFFSFVYSPPDCLSSRFPIPLDPHIYKGAKAEVDRLAPYNRDIFHLPDRYSVLGKIGSYQNIVVMSVAACSKSR